MQNLAETDKSLKMIKKLKNPTQSSTCTNTSKLKSCTECQKSRKCDKKFVFSRKCIITIFILIYISTINITNAKVNYPEPNKVDNPEDQLNRNERSSLNDNKISKIEYDDTNMLEQVFNKNQENKEGNLLVKNAEEDNEKESTNIESITKQQDTDNFFSAFVASISVILVSEIGDKTFFIAAIMSAQYNRLTIFSAAMSALALMTALSAAMGSLTTSVIKVIYTKFISNILFVLFGLRSLREGIKMSSTDDSEFKETDAELKEAEKSEDYNKFSQEPELGLTGKNKLSSIPFYTRCLRAVFSRIFLQAFTMTFLAEWGDRSQITTIILATTNDAYGVAAGGCLGHFICTGFACLGGRMIAQKISVKRIIILGGVVFLLFAIHGFYSMFVELENTVTTSSEGDFG